MNKFLILIILSFILVSNIGYSFSWNTHQWMSMAVYNRGVQEGIFPTGCEAEVNSGSIAPDADFMDFVNHHCYTLGSCVPSIYYTCPTDYDCPALKKATEWLNQSNYDSGCQEVYDISVASHYFFDSKVIWHQVSGEDTVLCHIPFENKVDENIKANYSEWSTTVCGQTVYSQNITTWINEFYDSIPKQPQNLTSNQSINNASSTSPIGIKQGITDTVSKAKAYQSELANLLDDFLKIFNINMTVGQFVVLVLSIAGIILFIFFILTHLKILIALIIILVIIGLAVYYFYPDIFITFPKVLP